jgi:hypothetical protein
MQSQTLKRYLAYSLLLVASCALSAASTSAQDRRTQQLQDRNALPINVALPVVQSECPRPVTLTLTAANPMTFVASDFNPQQVAQAHMSGFGDTAIDKNFLYTFQWRKEGQCCQITKAVLTVNMRSNGPGQSSSSADAGNDGIALMHAGAVVAPYNEAVYSNVPKPFVAGQLATKTWVLTGAALNNLNASGLISFAVQDDTSVVSATLQISGCCLSTPKTATVEAQSITASPN